MVHVWRWFRRAAAAWAVAALQGCVAASGAAPPAARCERNVDCAAGGLRVRLRRNQRLRPGRGLRRPRALRPAAADAALVVDATPAPDTAPAPEVAGAREDTAALDTGTHSTADTGGAGVSDATDPLHADHDHVPGAPEGEPAPGGGTEITLAAGRCARLPLARYRIGGYHHGVSVGGGRVHAGDDVTASAGTEVVAVYRGRVVTARRISTLGTLVEVRHTAPDGTEFYSIYGHLRSAGLVVREDQDVATGDRLGIVGTREENGGWPEHLHFSIFTGTYPATGVLRGHVPPSLLADYDDPVPFLEAHGRGAGCGAACAAGTSCARANPCELGAIDCSAGTPECVRAGLRPAGAACPGGTCDAAGACARCVPATCGSLGRACGAASDGCGATLDCGGCPLKAAGYRRRGPIGYIWASRVAPPTGRYHRPSGALTDRVRDLRRYSLNPPGIHAYANNPAETAPGWTDQGVRGFVCVKRL